MERVQLAEDCTIWLGDVRETLKQIPDGTVQTCVTSPPYFGLRDYGTAQWEGGDPNCDHDVRRWEGPKQTQGAQSGHAAKGDRLDRVVCQKCGAIRVDRQIGLEPTPEEYVATMVRVFHEVRRVLREDGTCWLNLGDSHAGSRGGPNGDETTGRHEEFVRSKRGGSRWGYGDRFVPGLKPKDLIGIPWRVALALQADDWYLRSDIIWHKPNPMPESVTDRPTKAHEYIFLLSKNARYYYDAAAVAEEAVQSVSGSRASFKRQGSKRGKPLGPNDHTGTHREDRPDVAYDGPTRNRRDVWTVATRSYPEAHFATFPPDLIEPCILAGSSPMACPICGAPWERVTERKRTFESGSGKAGHIPDGKHGAGLQGGGETLDIRRGPVTHVQTIGWAPTCTCKGNDGSGRSIVLDPFSGSGTTAQVALQHGRAYIGCELNPAYLELTRKRLNGLQTQFA